jgi:hypothetical protein
VSVTVGSRPTGQPLPSGFVGLSIEYTAVAAYANPAVAELVRKLAPGQRPVLRIGGNSTDHTWWPQRGELAPRKARFALGSSWLHAARTLAANLDARLILGLNMAGSSPQIAAAEARVFIRGIGSSYIQAFEIGNEPDEYGVSYKLGDYLRQFARWHAAVGDTQPVAGPAYATFNWPLTRFIHAEPGLKLVTYHRYPLRACLSNPAAPGYPTIQSLLSDQSSAGLARSLTPYVATAHRNHLAFRLDELNSASCSGKRGVSNAPASALWILDTLFNLARVGVDGVNVHTFPGAAYAPFSVSGRAYPEYYGMLMFTHAFPPGARLLPVASTGSLKAWATLTSGRVTRIVLINKDLHRTEHVRLHAPGLPARVHVEALDSHRSTAAPDSITVPAASAVLVAP